MMEFDSFGPAVGRLGSDSSRGARLRQSRSRGAELPLAPPLTLTTAEEYAYSDVPELLAGFWRKI